MRAVPCHVHAISKIELMLSSAIDVCLYFQVCMRVWTCFLQICIRVYIYKCANAYVKFADAYIMCRSED